MVDECAGPGVAQWLTALEHDVISIYPDSHGLDDVSILDWAVAENRILVTCDKDFGELVYLRRQPHTGIVLLRLGDETTNSKIAVLRDLLDQFTHLLEGNFVVATESRVRITVHGNPQP